MSILEYRAVALTAVPIGAFVAVVGGMASIHYGGVLPKGAVPGRVRASAPKGSIVSVELRLWTPEHHDRWQMMPHW